MSTTPSTAPAPAPPGPEPRGLEWVFIGPQGLRAGWSVLFAYWLFYFFRMAIGTIFYTANLVSEQNDYSATSMLILETVPLLAMLATGIIAAVLEHRHVLDFNLRGPGRASRFVAGLAAGFVALSALVGVLDLGGWLRFGPPALTGAAILRYAALWGCAFLLVGCVEEGLFRCYLQFTFTRGLNFWWALAAESALCLYLALHAGSRGAWGVYALAVLGLFPCLALHRRAAAGSAFWQAAWVTSTFFGLIHTFNHDENWMGVLAAASMGVVFCVSVRVTGSAWWAIGCHAAWDWTETYFYGTADSGLPARGHLFTTAPAGNPLLSGGADGPEGSVLVFGAMLLLLAVLLTLYSGRKTDAAQSYSGAD
jgi:uncharacterized protein